MINVEHVKSAYVCRCTCSSCYKGLLRNIVSVFGKHACMWTPKIYFADIFKLTKKQVHATALQYVLRQVQWKWNSGTDSSCCVSIRRLQVNLVVRDTGACNMFKELPHAKSHRIEFTNQYTREDVLLIHLLYQRPLQLVKVPYCRGWNKAGTQIVIKYGEGLQNFMTIRTQMVKVEIISAFQI